MLGQHTITQNGVYKMAQKHGSPDVDPQQLKTAQEDWRSFGRWSRYAIALVILALVILAAL
jgi:hypothetical protein